MNGLTNLLCLEFTDEWSEWIKDQLQVEFGKGLG